MDEWFETVEPLPNARVRLIFLPHAGAQPQAYFKWAKLLAPHVETIVASYPERGLRTQSPLPDSFEDMILRMVDALERDIIDVPYAFFGHSFGALVTYSIVRELSARNLVLPLHVFFSSALSPRQVAESPDIFSTLPDEQLYDVGVQKGWFTDISSSDIADAAAVKTMRMGGLRFLKTDLSFYEQFSFSPTPQFSVGELCQFGCTVVRADSDPGVPSDSLTGWLDVLSGEVRAGRKLVTQSRSADLETRVWNIDESQARAHLVTVIAEGAGHSYVDTHSSVLKTLLTTTLDDIQAQLPRAVWHGPALLDYKHVNYDSILHDIVSECAQRFPDRLAIIDEHTGHTMTYGDLEAEATGLAIWLQRHGCARNGIFQTSTARTVARGSCWPMAVLLPQDSFYASLNLAILKVGGALMPFYDNYNESLVVQLLETTQCEVAFTSAEFADRFPQDTSHYDVVTGVGDGSTATPGPQDESAPPRRRKRKLFIIDSRDMPQRQLLRSLGRNSDALLAWRDVAPECTPLDCAMLSFTSGSTGAPKAIIVSHASTVRCFLMRYHTVPYLPSPAVEVEAIHIFFAWEVLRPILVGHTALLLQKRTLIDPPSLTRACRQHHVSRIVVTASLTKNMLELVPNELRELGESHGLRNWMMMGEVLPRETVRSWQRKVPDVNLVNIYSTWESLDISQVEYGPRLHSRSAGTTRRQSHADLAKFATCGLPYPGVSCLVVDNSEKVSEPTKSVEDPSQWHFGGSPLQAMGVYGRVIIAGTFISDGYCGDLPKTQARFKRCLLSELPGGAEVVEQRRQLAATRQDVGLRELDPEYIIYDTGDSGRLLADGTLQLRGRDDGTVKIRGYKVPLVMVEKAFTDQPAVSVCVILPVPVPDQTSTDYLIAYVVPSDASRVVNADATEIFESEVLDAATRNLPTYMAPRFVFALPKLPLRPGNGKLDVKALPRPPAEMTSSTSAGPDKMISTEELSAIKGGVKKVIAIVSSLLDIDAREVTADDNFFSLGGHSLLAAQLAIELTKHFGHHHPDGWSITAVEIFQYPTPRLMADACMPTEPNNEMMFAEIERPLGAEVVDNNRVAVVGLAGIFPGAPDIATFWKNICDGVDSLTTFSADILRSKGVPEHVLGNQNWVKAGQVVSDADKFDGYFWGLQPHEINLLDPQQRLFLQTAYHALEDAGHAFFKPQSVRSKHATFIRSKQRTGVFAACGIDGYLIHHLDGGGLKTPLDPAKTWATEVGNEKDYISTRVSHQLNLGGPSFTVNSACSSGLVAVAQAVAAIRSGQCDSAVAGASSLSFPNFGYLYSDGLPASRDGRVRPFDDEASGTIFGDGVGAIVLKRLDHATRDGDRVYAEISGFSVTNDGNEKAGYSAPNAAAQARAIIEARRMAGVRPQEVSYVEAHATATHVGDAIEIQGLRTAFFAGESRSDHGGDQATALGSVKGNIGHANAAAGISGLIKTVLCLYHDTLVPTAHFRTVNKKLRPLLEGTPMYIQTKCEQWSQSPAGVGREQLIAGVSSFGVGGTNCHVVVHEATQATNKRRSKSARDPDNDNSCRVQLAPGFDDVKTASILRNAASTFLDKELPHLLPVTAKTVTALQNNLVALSQHLSSSNLEDETPRDIFLTLAERREHYPIRACVVVDLDEVLTEAVSNDGPMGSTLSLTGLYRAWRVVASRSLEARAGLVGQEVETRNSKCKSQTPTSWSTAGRSAPAIGLVFSGQGAEYRGMGRALYEGSTLFRETIDHFCTQAFDESVAAQLKDSLINSAQLKEDLESSLGGATITQPLVCLIQLALARVLEETVFNIKGQRTSVVAGHSLGEFAALATARSVSPFNRNSDVDGDTLCDCDMAEDMNATAVLRLVRNRGLITEQHADRGGMLSVVAHRDQLENSIDNCGLTGKVVIAVCNSQLYNVAAGHPSDLDILENQLKAVSPAVRCSRLHVKHAFHSPSMAKAAQLLKREASALCKPRFQTPTVPLLSSAMGGFVGGRDGSGATPMCGEFFSNHMTQPVRWYEVCRELLGHDSNESQNTLAANIVIEIGPGDVLCRLLSKNAKELGVQHTPVLLSTLPSARSYRDTGASALRHFFGTVGKLWELGSSIDWHRLFAWGSRSSSVSRQVSLPGYCFDKRSFWVKPTASIYVTDDNLDQGSKSQSKLSRVHENLAATYSPSSPSSSGCIVRFASRPLPPRLRLYCFPMAGGSSRLFDASSGWRLLSGNAHGPVEIVGIELPGRGQRLGVHMPDQAKDDAQVIAEAVADIVQDLTTYPADQFAFVGLSMGALLATLILQGVEETLQATAQVTTTSPTPTCSALIVAGRHPVWGSKTKAGETASPPEPSYFSVEVLRTQGLVPESLLQSKTWRDNFLPLLQADLALDSRLEMLLRMRSSDSMVPAPLSCPLVNFCGVDDPASACDRAADWRLVTTSKFGCSVNFLPGDHRFLTECASEICSITLSSIAAFCPELTGVLDAQIGSSMFANAKLAKPTEDESLSTHEALWKVKWIPLHSPSPLTPLTDTATCERHIHFINRKSYHSLLDGLEHFDGHVVTAHSHSASHDNVVNIGLVFVGPHSVIPANDETADSRSHTVLWDFIRFVTKLIDFVESHSEKSDDNLRIVLTLLLPSEADGTVAGLVAGASKCIPHEFPRITCTRLFVATPNVPMVEMYPLVDMLAQDLAVGVEDVQVCWRRVPKHRRGNAGTKWRCHARRLSATPIAAPKESVSAPALRSLFGDAYEETDHYDGPIIVLTGGTGALGKVLVNWLIDFHGVPPTAIVIITRRTVLEAHPRGVQIVAANIGDLTSLVGNHELRSIAHRVCGVFHLAGALRDGILTRMKADALEPVIAPKYGIINLLDALRQHRTSVSHLVEDACPPWVVAFSSSTSLFGYPSQANYAAANGLLDAWAQLNNSIKPLAAVFTAVNWGPWADVGMAKVGTKAYKQSIANGEIPMSNEDSLNHLNLVLHEVVEADCDLGFDQGAPQGDDGKPQQLQFLIARVDWEQSFWSKSAIPTRKRTLPDDKKADQKDHDGSNIGTPMDVQVEEFLQDRLSAWMPHETLSTHGVDSLDEVQLRNDFEKVFSTHAPLSTFSKTNQTLHELVTALASLLNA